jgi:diaminopimelate decarboxylase/aspartate kinase
MSQAGKDAWVVMKLGGTSVSSPGNLEHAIAAVRELQAAGKRVLLVQSAFAGVTNALEGMLATQDPEQQQKCLQDIEGRHTTLARSLGVEAVLGKGLLPHLERLKRLATGALLTGEVTPRVRAEVMGSGELMASSVCAIYMEEAGLAVSWMDARELLTAVPQPNQSASGQYLSAVCDYSPDPALAAKLPGAGQVVLTQGFIARNSRGETVLLGRGGSDTSAAYLAAMLGAERLEIWTDVAGLFSADPRDVPSARLLKYLDYDEAQEIATTGGKVLHPRCIEPARRYGFPIHIRCTPNPALPHTVIGGADVETGARVKAVSLRRGVALVTMETMGMWQQVGFLADAFACFKRHGLSVDLVSTSETSVTASLDPLANAAADGSLEALMQDLGRLCRARLITGCAAVSLVGRHIRANLHRLAPALALFEERHVYLTSQASNDLNLTFVVDEADADRLVQQLHALLIPVTENDNVFGPAWESLQTPVAATQPVQAWWQLQRSSLLKLAETGTPVYVYSKAAVAEAIAELRSLKSIDRLFYAVKANTHPELLRVIHAAGIGFETVSPGEIDHVRGLFPDLGLEQLLFTPNFAPRSEYEAGLRSGAMLTLDNLHPLREWPTLFAGCKLFLRVDTGLGAGHHRHVRTAGISSKFGIPMAELNEALSLANAVDARIVGLHAHLGSGILDHKVWGETEALLAKLAETFPDVHALDIGGGLGIPEKPGEHGLDLARLDETLSVIKQAHPNLELWLEPGRFLVARAGVLLAHVTQLKGKGEVRYVGVDAGMNSLIRPALYGAYHEIVNLTRLGGPAVIHCNIVGPICESGDILGLERCLPETREGDVLLIANTGAYGAVMSSRYNLREPAREVIL